MKIDEKVFLKLHNFVDSAESLLDDGVEFFLSKNTEFKEYLEKENLIDPNQHLGDEKKSKRIRIPREIYAKTRLSASTQLNSNFVYLLALFERYVSDVIDICCSKPNSIFRKKLWKLFVGEAWKHSEGKRSKPFALSNEELNRIIKEVDYKKVIEHKHELGNPMDIFRRLFLNTSDIPGFDERRIRYTEARERRNLFVHRGEIIDDKYTQTINQTSTTNFKNNQKKIEKVLKSIHSLGLYKDEGNLSISPFYLTRVTGLLYWLSHAIFFSTFTLSKKELQAKMGPLSLQHQFMILSKKHPPLAFDVEEVYKMFLLKFGGGLESIDKIPDTDKVNIALNKNHLLKFFKGKDKKTDELVQKNIDFIVSNVVNQNKKNAVKAVFSNDKDLILNSIKGLLNDPVDPFKKDEMKTWFMYQDFLKDKNFLKAFEEI